MWKRTLAFYDWLGRIDFARNMIELILGKGVWSKIFSGGFALAVAAAGWFTSSNLAPWQRIGIALAFAVLALLAAHLVLGLVDGLRHRRPAVEKEPPYEPSFLMPLRELFAHIHPLPLDDTAERDAIGREVIDQIAAVRLGSYGRRVEGSKRLALEPIPHNVWARGKFTYWFLDSRMDNDSLHLECARDQPGLPPLHYADVHVIREQALDIWSFIPLKDAARIAYEHSRESLFAKAAERFGEGPTGTLQYYANTIFLYHPVYGEKPPSSLRELIAVNLRPSTRVSDGCDQLLAYNNKEPDFVNLTVAKADLDAFIACAKTTRLESEPG